MTVFWGLKNGKNFSSKFSLVKEGTDRKKCHEFGPELGPYDINNFCKFHQNLLKMVSIEREGRVVTVFWGLKSGKNFSRKFSLVKEGTDRKKCHEFGPEIEPYDINNFCKFHQKLFKNILIERVCRVVTVF